MQPGDDGSGLRAARWVGRVVTLLAAWPLWYAFYGKLELDWEAMMVGGPGVLIGLCLWGWAGYRLRRSQAEPIEQTVGDMLAARFDAAIAAFDGSVATIGLTVVTGLLAYPLVRQLARTDGEASEAAVVLAIVFAVLVFGWRAARGPALAAGIAALIGIALISKPWLAPVTREWMGEVHELSPSSETHLYYVIPGIGLCVLAAALLASIEVRKSGAPIQREPIQLDPPRPKPPEPPSP